VSAPERRRGGGQTLVVNVGGLEQFIAAHVRSITQGKHPPAQWKHIRRRWADWCENGTPTWAKPKPR